MPLSRQWRAQASEKQIAFPLSFGLPGSGTCPSFCYPHGNVFWILHMVWECRRQMTYKSVEVMTSGFTTRSIWLNAGICGFLLWDPKQWWRWLQHALLLSQPGSADQHLDQSNIRSPHSRLRGVRKQPRLGWQEVTHHQLNSGIVD